MFSSMNFFYKRKNYHEDGCLLFCKFNFTNGKTFQKSASVNSKILTSLSLVNGSQFDLFGYVFDDSVNSFLINQIQIVAISFVFVLGLELLHVLTRSHELLFILSQTLQEHRIFHLPKQLMSVREALKTK